MIVHQPLALPLDVLLALVYNYLFCTALPGCLTSNLLTKYGIMQLIRSHKYSNARSIPAG